MATRMTLILAAAVLLSLAACSSGGAARNAQGGAAAQGEAGADAFAAGSADGGGADGAGADGGGAADPVAAAPPKPTGPAIVVTWEALAREKYLLENSRFKRRGPQPPQKIMLISKSHPNADALASGRGQQRDPSVSTAIMEDRDILLFLKGMRRSGFYKYARPAGYDTAVAGSDDARGRVTVTRGSESRSLLSIRGQGLNDRTKEIPAIYSEAKQAIMALRNMTPTLNVTRSGATGRVNVR